MTGEWQPRFTYEEVKDPPAVGVILIGTLGICCGLLAILLLLAMP